MRVLHNGNALAFQARVEGSIPSTRSSFALQNWSALEAKRHRASLKLREISSLENIYESNHRFSHAWAIAV